MTIKQNLALEDIELVIQYLITGFPLIFSLQGVMDTSLGRIHVELYKEIKKVKEGKLNRYSMSHVYLVDSNLDRQPRKL